MVRTSRRSRVGCSTLSLVLLAACQDGTAPPVEDHAALHASREVTANALPRFPLARAVRQATSRFHSTQQATAAGYAVASPCVSSPAGGMGFHWVNNALIDPVFDPLKPEAVLYVPGRNGQLQIVAVEYIVLDVGQTPPRFGETPFDVGGTPVPVPHWSLHFWLYRENPNGPFTPFNPNVVCPTS